MDNIIKKIVLDLGKKQVELTPEQCKKLKDALDEMFGQKIVKEEHHHHDHYSYPYWYWYPNTTYSIQETPYPDYTVWCSNNCKASYSDNTMTLSVA